MIEDEALRRLLKDNPGVDASSLGEVEELLRAVREAGVKKNVYSLSGRNRSPAQQTHTKLAHQPTRKD